MKKVPQLPVCTRDRYIVSIERVYTASTLYMKSAVAYPCQIDRIFLECPGLSERGPSRLPGHSMLHQTLQVQKVQGQVIKLFFSET